MIGPIASKTSVVFFPTKQSDGGNGPRQSPWDFYFKIPVATLLDPILIDEAMVLKVFREEVLPNSNYARIFGIPEIENDEHVEQLRAAIRPMSFSFMPCVVILSKGAQPKTMTNLVEFLKRKEGDPLPRVTEVPAAISDETLAQVQRVADQMVVLSAHDKVQRAKPDVYIVVAQHSAREPACIAVTFSDAFLAGCPSVDRYIAYSEALACDGGQWQQQVKNILASIHVAVQLAPDGERQSVKMARARIHQETIQAQGRFLQAERSLFSDPLLASLLKSRDAFLVRSVCAHLATGVAQDTLPLFTLQRGLKFFEGEQIKFEGEIEFRRQAIARFRDLVEQINDQGRMNSSVSDLIETIRGHFKSQPSNEGITEKLLALRQQGLAN